MGQESDRLGTRGNPVRGNRCPDRGRFISGTIQDPENPRGRATLAPVRGFEKLQLSLLPMRFPQLPSSSLRRLPSFPGVAPLLAQRITCSTIRAQRSGTSRTKNSFVLPFMPPLELGTKLRYKFKRRGWGRVRLEIAEQIFRGSVEDLRHGTPERRRSPKDS